MLCALRYPTVARATVLESSKSLQCADYCPKLSLQVLTTALRHPVCPSSNSSRSNSSRHSRGQPAEAGQLHNQLQRHLVQGQMRWVGTLAVYVLLHNTLQFLKAEGMAVCAVAPA